MRNKEKHRFKSYIVNRTIIIASIPFSLVFFVAVIFGIRSYTQSEIKRQMLLTETLASETNIHFVAANDIIETSAYYIQQAALYPDTNRNELYRYLSSITQKNLVFSSIWVTDIETGTVVFGLPSVPSVEGYDMTGTEIYSDVIDSDPGNSPNVIWSNVIYNKFYTGNYISASIRIDKYFLTAWFNPTSLIGIISDQKWQRGQFGFVCDKQGRIISHPEHSLVKTQKDISEIPAIAEALTGLRSHSFSQLSGTDKQEYLYTVVPEKNTGWLIGVAHARQKMFQYLIWIILGGVLSFVISSLIIVFGANRASQHVAKGLSEIVKGTEAIAAGNYNIELGDQEFLEFSNLCESVRTVQTRVKDRENKLQELNQRLETKVKERTGELQQSNMELKSAMNELSYTQEKIIKTEKLTALGQLAAGIAHELNTPLGATISAESVLEQFFFNDIKTCLTYLLNEKKETQEIFLELYTNGIKNAKKTSTIVDRKVRKDLQNNLRDIGVTANYRIADYLINSGISNLVSEDPEFFSREDHEQILKYLNTILIPLRMTSIIAEAAQKSVRVVQALQNYLRQDSAEAFLAVNIEEGIESVLTLLYNKFKHGVNVERDFEGITIYAVSHQLSQVWMNLLSNAAQAMNYKGTIKICTKQKDDKAQVTFQDDGPGISNEILPKIFEPFFTTKQGEGMGLGLDICKRIIEKHRGTINVKSKPGETIFTVEFPLAAGKPNLQDD